MWKQMGSRTKHSTACARGIPSNKALNSDVTQCVAAVTRGSDLIVIGGWDGFKALDLVDTVVLGSSRDSATRTTLPEPRNRPCALALSLNSHEL